MKSHTLDLTRKPTKPTKVYDYIVGTAVIALAFAAIIGWQAALTPTQCTAINQHTVTCQ